MRTSGLSQSLLEQSLINMCMIKSLMDGRGVERRDLCSILLSPDYEHRVRSVQSVASCLLLALWLPCVTHGSSMLHSLLPTVCLFVSPLTHSVSQPHSLPSSCLPLSFPQALIRLLCLSCSLISKLDILFMLFPFPSFSVPLSLLSWVKCWHWFPTLFPFICLAYSSCNTLMESAL